MATVNRSRSRQPRDAKAPRSRIPKNGTTTRSHRIAKSVASSAIVVARKQWRCSSGLPVHTVAPSLKAVEKTHAYASV